MTLSSALPSVEQKQAFLPFALPDIGEDEIAEVIQAMRSGWLTTGPKTRQFETEFGEFLGGGVHTIAINSATAGLHLALEAMGVGAGDEVITSTYTFTATAEVVRYLGADPVFVDIDPRTMNMSPAAVEAKITPRTKVIIPVHFAGLSCDMDALCAIARRHNLKILEDAAHALPTYYNQRLIGTLDTDATVFSFYATKTITTGEGGMIAARDAALIERCKVMRLHGISRDSFDRYRSRTPAWQYDVVAPGFKYNLTDVASSIGIPQLRKARAMRDRRAELAARYTAALQSVPIIVPPDAAQGGLHAWHLYVIRLQETARITRDGFIQRMADAGIGCSVHFIPLHLHPYWRDTYNYAADAFPAATRAYQAAISLPLYSKMTDADATRVVETVRRILDTP